MLVSSVLPAPHTKVKATAVEIPDGCVRIGGADVAMAVRNQTLTSDVSAIYGNELANTFNATAAAMVAGGPIMESHSLPPASASSASRSARAIADEEDYGMDIDTTAAEFFHGIPTAVPLPKAAAKLKAKAKAKSSAKPSIGFGVDDDDDDPHPPQPSPTIEPSAKAKAKAKARGKVRPAPDDGAEPPEKKKRGGGSGSVADKNKPSANADAEIAECTAILDQVSTPSVMTLKVAKPLFNRIDKKIALLKSTATDSQVWPSGPETMSLVFGGDCAR